jgi:hypothetical protein
MISVMTQREPSIEVRLTLSEAMEIQADLDHSVRDEHSLPLAELRTKLRNWIDSYNGA